MLWVPRAGPGGSSCSGTPNTQLWGTEGTSGVMQALLCSLPTLHPSEPPAGELPGAAHTNCSFLTVPSFPSGWNAQTHPAGSSHILRGCSSWCPKAPSPCHTGAVGVKHFRALNRERISFSVLLRSPLFHCFSQFLLPKQ